LLDEGRTYQEAWQDSLALVQAAERLGYHRFWLAEHHNVHALTIGSPEVVISYLASQTQRIHLGSGGIMGLHYSPYKIAELAASLETLFPG
ncbi:LLM class flavin-dependent oxidoreductase, partial [Streptococcus suis]